MGLSGTYPVYLVFLEVSINYGLNHICSVADFIRRINEIIALEIDFGFFSCSKPPNQNLKYVRNILFSGKLNGLRMLHVFRFVISEKFLDSCS